MFDAAGVLDRLEGFTSRHGAAFYRLPPNPGRITLTRGDAVTYTAKIATADGPLTLFDPGFALHWSVTP